MASVSSAPTPPPAASALRRDPAERGFSARSGRIAVSATSARLMEADALRAAGRDLVDFGVGEPDFPTPPHIVEALQEALRAGFTKYTPTGGISSLKDAICQAHARDFGSAYQRENVLVTSGGKHALFDALSVVLEHGDEVILPAPYWVSFRDQIRYMGATPVEIPTDEAHGFTLPLEAIAAAITPRTKVILLNSPNNPSGAVFSAATCRGTLELCRRFGIWLVSDECYAKFVYDGALYSVGSEPDSQPWLIIAGSMSKTYAMTGWRLGYALAPKEVIRRMLGLQSHLSGNTCSFVQKAAIAALLGPQEPVAAMLAEYRRRRDFVVARLAAMPGITCGMPAGAFYAYPNVRTLLSAAAANGFEFTSRLLQETGVVTVPGEAFGTSGQIRISYATSMAALAEGLDRLQGFATRLLN